jgi:uncharacterized protein YuzE
MKAKKASISASVNPETGHVGSLYIRFLNQPVAKTVPVKDPCDPELLLDLDKRNRLVGIEILAADMLRDFCRNISKELPRQYASKLAAYCETA